MFVRKTIVLTRQWMEVRWVPAPIPTTPHLDIAVALPQHSPVQAMHRHWHHEVWGPDLRQPEVTSKEKSISYFLVCTPSP